MRLTSRRSFLSTAAQLTVLPTIAATTASEILFAADKAPVRKFTLDLRCGSIGVGADQQRAIELAQRFGFESVNAEPGYLVKLSDSELADLQAELAAKSLVWGAAGLPVEFRKDDQSFLDDLKQLPAQAAALQKAGVDRIGTWLMPRHDSLTYVENFRRHARRLSGCCRILADYGLRFGMEYVGPKTLWASSRHSFIHTMAETKELISEMNVTNAGFILDSWHWYTAHETVDDLKTLSNKDIIACDLNDAPVGIEIDEQLDNQRELPCATGVIDLAAFLNTLAEIGYDGPIRAEPFNKALNQMDDEPAVAATAAAMKKAFTLVEDG
ncbi:MAG: sugar phosphate isomerase/epimerase [Planctomycetaceae bacterium]|nr:sugar phosphate isomerase/epimerase [Planctomycetaceae bacterium]